MKKLLFTLIALFVVVALSAQTRIAPDYTIGAYGTAGETFVPVGTATALPANASAAATDNEYIFRVNAQAPYFYSYCIRLFDDTGSNTATAAIWGSQEGTYWKSLTSVSYTGVGTDTAIIGAVSTAVPYPYLKFVVTPSDSIWVSEVSLTTLPIAR